MEDLLNRVLNPILGRFLANKEKPNLKLNFLKGRGVMRNLVFNTEEINKLLQDAPIRVAMLAIDQLSIKASLTRISTQPVTVFIDHINLDVYEPPVTPSRRPAATDPVDAAPRLPQPSRRPYGLSDRIADGIRVEVNEVRVRVRTLGKRKCPKVGEWSPPDGLWILRNVQWCSTNEAGVEGDLDECWRFNKGRRSDYYVFKRMSVEAMSFYVVPRTAGASGGEGPVPSPSPIAVLRPTPLECRVTYRRGLRDVGVVYGVEVDVSLDRAVLRLGRADGSLRHFVACAVGLAHCLARKHAMPNMPSAQAGEDGCQPAWPRDYGDGARVGPSAAGGWSGPSSAFSSSSALTHLDDVALEQHEDRDGQHGRTEGHGEEQGDGEEEEEEDEEEEEGDEESVGSDDSGFSNGVSAASFLPDLSSLGEAVDVDLGDDDDQTTTTVSHTSSAAPSYAPSAASPSSTARRASPRMRVALSLTFARLEVRFVDDGEGGFQISMDGLRSEVIKAEDAGPSEFIGQGRLGRFEVRALGGDEEVLWHQPALLRPHCPSKAEGDGEAQLSQPQGPTAFPAFVRRGIRLDRDFPGLADDEAQDDNGQGLTGGGEVLRVRNHVLAHPPPPPPEVASRVEARLARLHVYLDTDAWARLANLLRGAMDRRWWDGEWGPAVEGYVLQPPLPLGIRHIVLRGEGLGLHLPPTRGMSRAEGACMGAPVEVGVVSYSLRVGDHLPGCLADAPGFLDPRLPSTPPDPPPHTPRGTSQASTDDGPNHTPAPLRLQVSVCGVSLCVGPTPLLAPFATTMLLSIDAQGPLPDSPQPLAYVPLCRHSRLSVSLSLEPLCVCLHLPSWLSLVESLTAHLATLGRLTPPHAQPPPSPQPQGGGLKGAALLLVLKAGGLRLVLPEHGSQDKWEREARTASEGRGSRHEEKGETGRSPAKRPAAKKGEGPSGEALLSVEVRAVEAVTHVSHSGAASFDCLVGRCALGVRDTEGMLDVVEVAPLPRGSRRAGEEGQGKEAGVLVRWRREDPLPSSERATFLAPHPPPDQQAGPDVAVRLSLHVLCPLTLRAPLPLLTAAATDLHALLSHPHASSLPLPSSSSFPSSAFPPGSLGHALLCLLPRPALHPLTPSPLLTGHSRHRAAVGVVDVALTSLLLHVPLPCAPSHAAGGVLKASLSEGAVHGTMDLNNKRRGERAEQTWTLDGTLHASLSTPQKHRQAPIEVPALSNWRVGMGLRVLPNGGGEGEHSHSGWRVMWQPPTQPLILHPSTQVEHALRRVQVDLSAFLTTCGDLFGGRRSGGLASLQHLDRWIAAMGAAASDPTASCTPQAERVEANGDDVEEEELDVIERLAGTLRGELHAHAWHASEQAAALSQRLHATQQALAHATQSSARQLEALGEQVRQKEVQRLALLALHHADHSGYLRIGALASAPNHPGRTGRHKGWSSKALLSLPRAYCVVRGGLLLCHDRPHSLVVDQAFPLRAEALADFLPRDHAAPRHCRRAHALLYRGTPLLPDSGNNKAFILVAEGEEDLRQWKAALAAYLHPHSLGPQQAPASDPSSPRATARRATAPAICRAQSLDHLPPPAPSTTRSLRRTLLGRGVSNEAASSSVDGPSEATGAAPRDGPLLRAGKTLKHSFSFSPGRMLLRAATPGRPLDTAPAPLADKDRLADDGEGTQQAHALQQAAEEVRRLQLSVTGVVASAAGGSTTHRPEGEGGTGLGSSWGSTRDAPLPCYIIATSPPLATARADVDPGAMCEGPEGSGAGVQACVSRTWAELLSFHGRYHDRWAAATQAADEEDEASGDKATPRMRSLLPRQASASGSGMLRGEARGYANALLMGMQAALGTLATHEAGRRLQAETVERYLRLLLPACPADLQCLRLLSDFLGHDLGAHQAPRQPARSADAVGITALAEPQRGRDPDSVPAPDSRSGSPVPPLPRPRPRGFSALVPPSSSRASDTTNHRRTVSLAPSVGVTSVPPPDPVLDEADEVERVAAEMEGLRQAVHELQHAHQGAAVALALQSALFDDYRRVGRRQRDEDRRARRVAESRWRREVRRATWLEAQLNQAQAARDDALAGLDQVTSYSARKLVDAEGRYEQLLRSGGPRPAVHKAMSIRRLSAVFTGNKQHRHQQQQQQQQQSPQTRWGGIHAHGAHHGLTRQNTVTGAETSAAPPAHLHRQLSLPAHTDHHASPRRGSNPLMDEAESSVEASMLDRLSRALEAKSLEAKRAEEGMKMAVEEARSLRALLEGQGGLGESEGRRLREEAGRERARAEVLERELGQVRAEWLATVGQAVEALRGDREDGAERTKRRETRGQAMLQVLLKALNARGRFDGLQDK